MDIASLIDQTLLKPEATAADIDRLCRDARRFHFATVCVHPVHVARAATCLKGSTVGVATVVGFPLGANRTDTKVYETRRALRDGAREIDVVMNLGALKGRADAIVLRDLRGVARACHAAGACCKVILETGRLTDREKRRACRLAVRAGADFVKTSTGFGPGGATVDDVALLSRLVRNQGVGVKAAGGIRSLADLRKMIAAGATRIGTSSGVEIVQELSRSRD